MDTASIVSLFAILLALCTVVFTFWSSGSSNNNAANSAKISKLEKKLKILEKQVHSDAYVVDTITGALHAVDHRQTILFYMIEESISDEFLFDAEDRQFADLQTRLTELGLFSNDKVRRISAQRSLAHSAGDFKSLELMKKIEKGELGKKDIELADQIKVLKLRLNKLNTTELIWPGRPSGGEF